MSRPSRTPGSTGRFRSRGFVDEAADFASRLGDVDQQGVPATGRVIGGHEGLLLVSHGAGAVTSRAAPLNRAGESEEEPGLLPNLYRPAPGALGRRRVSVPELEE